MVSLVRTVTYVLKYCTRALFILLTLYVPRSMKVFEDSLYKEQEKAEALDVELGALKIEHSDIEEKYADVSSNLGF